VFSSIYNRIGTLTVINTASLNKLPYSIRCDCVMFARKKETIDSFCVRLIDIMISVYQLLTSIGPVMDNNNGEGNGR
jgi:hypothetical protein